MNCDNLQVLSLRDACDHFESMTCPLQPATLHPAYVAADARRNPVLEPAYLLFASQGERWLHSLHLARVAGTGMQDGSSPYGYGGPLSTSADAEFLAQAWQAYSSWMTEQRVVVEYVRFHPVLANERWYGGSAQDNRMVVWVDLQAGDPGSAYPSRLRQTLRKAQLAGLVYSEVPLAPHARDFGVYYRQGMTDIGADPFFLFGDDYFERLAATGRATLGVCRRTAGVDGAWLAASIFLEGRGVREYHLAATNGQGRAVGASAFLLHQAALAARLQGLQCLYLGGGSDARPDNPLLFFKASFSPERLAYRTGSCVFRPADYDDLKLRFAADWSAHPERPVFYRKV